MDVSVSEIEEEAFIEQESALGFFIFELDLVSLEFEVVELGHNEIFPDQ